MVLDEDFEMQAVKELAIVDSSAERVVRRSKSPVLTVQGKD